MKIVYTDVLVIGGGLAGPARRDRRQAARPRRDHPVARAAEALAFGGGAGRHAGLARQRRSRARATTRTSTSRTPCAAATGAPTSASCACSSTPRPRRCASSPRGACRGAASRSGDRAGRSSTARRSRSPSATRRTAWSRSATSAAPRSGAPATSPTAPATRCCTRSSDRAIAESIPVHERMEAIALIHDGGRCYGAVVRDLVTGELSAYVAKATAIATGGAGRLYRVTTNAVICEGIGTRSRSRPASPRSATWRRCSSIPTGIFPAGILVTEGCRGDGGLLKDVDGHRFMPDYEPEKKELASRDVVSRRMEEHISEGQGREVALRRAPLARHHAARRAPHRAQPARGQGDLPVLPRHRSGRRTDRGAAGAALHDGRRAHRPHRPEPDAEGPVRRRRGRVLGHARLQPARRQLGRRDRRRRNDRRRVRRRLLRRPRQRRRHPDRARARVRRARAGQARAPDLGRAATRTRRRIKARCRRS